MKIVLPLLACLSLLSRPTFAQDLASGTRTATLPDIDQYNLTWDVTGRNSAASMPLGNGDIGLNAWVDPGGDLLFYVSKTYAWGGVKDSSADSWMQQGGVLMKLGLIRTSLIPKPAVSPFIQTLQIRHGEITIRLGEGAAAIDYRIWADANHPVIRVEANGSSFTPDIMNIMARCASAPPTALAPAPPWSAPSCGCGSSASSSC